MKPTPEAIAEAKLHPNEQVYVIEGIFSPEETVPAQAVKGAWRVDAVGNLAGEFIPNPNYVPNYKAHCGA